MSFKLREGFLLGTASAATQIEGGDLDHSWNDWYNQGKINDGSNPARANDHYNRWQEDADIMASMGLKIYRLGIEWARICPKENEFDENVLKHYRDEIEYIKSKGIKVLLTLHHFTNPMWFDRKGGFLNYDNGKYFLDFVEKVIEGLGDIVSDYITINEPNVFATNSYFYGIWPPGEKSFFKAQRVISNLAAIHVKAYKLIHETREKMGYKDTMISFANHIMIFDPRNEKNIMHKFFTRLVNRAFQGAGNQALYLGKFIWPLKNRYKIEAGEYCDFIALNYYRRGLVKYFKIEDRNEGNKNDLGWEIYPEGLIRSAQMLYDVIKKPIYVTENGTCDNNDTFRCRYIYEHLKAISESNLPIERYYHWCFCDNFEWAEGESSRFGLVHVDYETQKRTVKKSGEFFSEIVKNNGVTDEMYNKYVKEQEYHF